VKPETVAPKKYSIRVGGLLRSVLLYVAPPVREEIVHRSLEWDNRRPSRRRMKSRGVAKDDRSVERAQTLAIDRHGYGHS
jgi:hypothetical protein